MYSKTNCKIHGHIGVMTVMKIKDPDDPEKTRKLCPKCYAAHMIEHITELGEGDGPEEDNEPIVIEDESDT